MEARWILIWAVGFAALPFLVFIYPALFGHGHNQIESVFAILVFTPCGGLFGLTIGFVVWLFRQWPYFEKRGRIPPEN